MFFRRKDYRREMIDGEAKEVILRDVRMARCDNCGFEELASEYDWRLVPPEPKTYHAGCQPLEA